MVSNIYQSPNWQRVRLKVFERDGFTCRVCGADDRQLHCHHLRYGKETRENDCVTLCNHCHDNLEFIVKGFREDPHLVLSGNNFGLFCYLLSFGVPPEFIELWCRWMDDGRDELWCYEI